MKNKTTTVMSVLAALLVVLCTTGPVEAGTPARPNLQGGAPTVVSYQGQVIADGSPYNGTGYFMFAIVDADENIYWTNDGQEPASGVSLTVTDGLFDVLLGDTTLTNMTEPLTAEAFGETGRYLRVWFSADDGDYLLLAPDRRIAAVPYALQAQEAADADTLDGEHASAFADAIHIHAPTDISPQGTESGLDADTVDGLHANELETHYQNVVTVAKGGGDYASVQAAIDSITDASEGNPYLVWVAPGVYSETVTLKPYVHLQGAGQEVTIITSTVSSSWPPSQATLVLAQDTSLRDLTVGNSGTDSRNVALLATTGTNRVLVADVTARAHGNGEYNCAIFLTGSGTGVTIQQVTALADASISDSYGLYNSNGAVAKLRGGSFTARGESSAAYGIYNVDSGTMLEAEGVTALAENGSGLKHGLYNGDGAQAKLRGGSFTTREGSGDACGICNVGSGTTLETEGVTALAENGSGLKHGLYNGDGAQARLHSDSFTGRGASSARGIDNVGSSTTLEATNVVALGEDGGTNYGLHNSGAAATLHSGFFTARGGSSAYGIYSSGATLNAEGVTALAESDSGENYGLFNYGTAATLRGGFFTARGGSGIACGISNAGSSAILEATNVVALGESGSTNYGLLNSSATAKVDSSRLTGSTYGLYVSSGTAGLGVTQLDGGAFNNGGTLTCFQVYDDTYAGYTCP